MRVIVCGGRDYDKAEVVDDTLKQHKITVLIQGGANGADRLAKWYAKAHDIPMIEFPAQWKKYGNGAGHIRNSQMIIEGKPDLVIAFPGGKGTANMVAQAKARNIKVIEIKASLSPSA